MSCNNSLIELEKVNTWFPHEKGIFGRVHSWVKAVNNVCLDIFEGECLGLVGESGCGKSTLGRTVLRLAPLSSGLVRFMGDDIGQLEDRKLKPYRPGMQMVFQDPKASLNPKMTVFEILKEALYLNRKIHQKQYFEAAVNLLNRVDLRADHVFRYPHEFSGGQQQRICIARALATDPKFIVFDEATSALDVSVQAQILNLMGELQQTLNLTYLFISHDLSILEHVCDRVAVMYAGQIVEIQKARDLFLSPRHPYSKALKDAVPVADPEAGYTPGILKGEVARLSALPTGCFFHPRCVFSKDICRIREPEISRIETGSWVRCHFHEKLFQKRSLFDSKEIL